jgi:D-amino-acid dehydrogenase
MTATDTVGLGEGRSVTVVGAGIVGVACAIHLLRRGYRVTLVDREAPGEGASVGNAGVMAPCAMVPVATPDMLWKVPRMLLDPMGPLSLRWRYMPRVLPWLLANLRNATTGRVEYISNALAPLLHGSVEEHQALAEGTGAEDWLRPAPYLYVYESEDDFARESFVWNIRRRHGAKFQVLVGEAVRDLEPALGPSYRCAVVLEDHGFIRDPLRLVEALVEHFARSGGTLLRGEVKDVEIGPDRPRRLVTNNGALDLDVLVIAAGAWSGKLAARLGSTVPLETERGYHVVLTDPGRTPRYPIMSSKGKFVATPMAPGLRLAGLVEFAGLDAPPNYARARTLLEHAKRLFPDVRTERFTEWMGHRPALPDSLPVIGRSPRFATVFYAFGHQHVGMTGGPKTGRLIADMIAGRAPDIDVSPFRVDRF